MGERDREWGRHCAMSPKIDRYEAHCNWVDDPPSAEIASILALTGAPCCPHGLSICFVYCGVYIKIFRWRPIPDDARFEFKRIVDSDTEFARKGS